MHSGQALAPTRLDPLRFFTAAAIVMALGSLPGCTSESGDAATHREQLPVPVSAMVVRQADIPIQVKAVGTVEAFSTVTVKSQVEGALAGVHFNEGDAVKKDQLLFTIDPRPYEAAVRQAEANLARDQAEAKNAAADAERRRRLFEQGLISRDEFERSQTNAAVLEATLLADEAAVDNTRLRLQYCYIRSPVDGRAGQLLVNQGNLIKANDSTLTVLNQVRPAYVAFAVPEPWLPEIRERAAAGELAVDVEIKTDPPRHARGELRFVNNTVDTTTGTVLLKGLFDNDDETLWPGQFVDVSLTLRVERGALLVPLAAVQTGQQGQFVYVVNPQDHSVDVRPVVTGDVLATDVVIREGLRIGELVVTDGQLRLAPGSKVEVKAEPTAASS